MFDYFLRFSAFLADLTGAECEWLQDQLAIVHVVDGAKYPEGELPEGKTESDATWTGCRAYLEWNAYEPDPADEVGFLYSFADKPDNAGRWFLHLYATQSANVANVAYIVQKFLKRFRPTDSWFLTFCVGSDRAAIGEFGGGAVFVTATTVESFTVEEWATRRVRDFENRTEHATAPDKTPRIVLNVSGGELREMFPPENVQETQGSPEPLPPSLPHAKHYIDAGGGFCPACRSDQIEGNSVDIDGRHCTQRMDCLDCDTVWFDAYTLSSIEPC